MTALSVRDFRNNLARFFNLADQGERVFVRRGNRLYALVSVANDDLEISPALAAKIDKAREDLREGRTVGFESAAAAQSWMDEL